MRKDHIKQIKEGNSQTFYMSYVWRKKRLKILDRDNWECQRCKKLGRVSTVGIKEDGEREEGLTVHHIKELKDYPELGLTNSNLTTLCFNCHNIIHDRFEGKKPKIDIPERW